MTDKDKCECRNNDALLYWCGPKKLRCWHCGREYQAVYVPVTPLGKKLTDVRERIVASGEPLLDADGIDQELGRNKEDEDALEAE